MCNKNKKHTFFYKIWEKISKNKKTSLKLAIGAAGFGIISAIIIACIDLHKNPEEITLTSALIIIGIFAIKGAMGGALKGFIVGTMEGKKIFQKPIALRGSFGGAIGTISGFLLFRNIEACAIGTILGAIIGIRFIPYNKNIRKISKK